jgi:hypothetical protein
MATNFPTSLDTPTNPIGTNQVTSPDHAGQHADANDAIKALEAKVGVNNSAVTTSHDYKLSGVTGADKSASVAGSENLSNKTLTTPTIASFTNATHNHTNSAGGGTLAESALALTDVTTNDATASKHGFLPKLSGNSSQFLDGSGNFSTPSSATTMLTHFPRPVQTVTVSGGNQLNDLTFSGSSTAYGGMVSFNAGITVNKITFRSGGAHTTNGTIKIVLYSEDGQTKLIDVSSPTISAAGTEYTATVSAVSVPAGNYYLFIVPQSTIDSRIRVYETNASNLNTVTSEPVMEGTIAVTAGAVPSTITPGSITSASRATAYMRFDN